MTLWGESLSKLVEPYFVHVTVGLKSSEMKADANAGFTVNLQKAKQRFVHQICYTGKCLGDKQIFSPEKQYIQYRYFFYVLLHLTAP